MRPSKRIELGLCLFRFHTTASLVVVALLSTAPEAELGDGDSGEAAEAEPAGFVAEDEAMAEVPVKARKAPNEPIEMERLQYEAAHLPYRSWCQHCVRGRGRTKPHHRKMDADPENAVPRISMDLFFLGSD